MKKYKKLLTITCIGLLCITALAGCKKKPEETEAPTQETTEAATEKPTEKQTEPQTQKETEKQSEKQSESGSEAQTEAAGNEAGSDDASGTSSSGEQRYFFDESGNTINTTQNSSGDWVDKDGTVYTFLENGVKDSDGTNYYYDPPSYRDSSSDSSSTGTDTGDAVDLYSADGTLTRLTKDANGNWADKNDVTYELRDDGAMDSNGNFHPW